MKSVHQQSLSKSVLYKPALKRIKGIHRLSRDYNRRLQKNHGQRLLELMGQHIKEIEELYRRRDRHYLIETGDLMVLCFELVLEDKASVDAILTKCFERYEKKLAGLIRGLDEKVNNCNPASVPTFLNWI